MKRSRIRRRFVLALALAAAPVSLVAAHAAPQTAASKMSSSKMSSGKMMSSKMAVPAADKKFMIESAQGGVAEVMMGNLAAKKGRSAAVKNFGRKMVMDHSKANANLKAVAMKNKVMLPKSPNAEQQATYKKLSSLSGTAFDRAYTDEMVKDHKHDVAEFAHEAKTGKNADVKNFAAKTLPTLKMHLSMIQSIHAKMK